MRNRLNYNKKCELKYIVTRIKKYIYICDFEAEINTYSSF